MRDYYQATYEISDGYVGKDRPQRFKIYLHSISDDVDDEDLKDLYEEYMNDHYDQNIMPEPKGDDVERFIQWVKENKGEA